MLSKSQRIVAFYILYEVYHHENVQMTPFEAVVYSSLQACAQADQTIWEAAKQGRGGGLAGGSSGQSTAAPLNQALSGQSHVHVNDLSGMNGATGGGNVPAPASGTSALLSNANGSSISPDSHFRAEYKLLTDFLVSVPKVSDCL